jgi:hypothetical protein
MQVHALDLFELYIWESLVQDIIYIQSINSMINLI